MATRHFTPEEANALLPRLRPLMAELLERRARVVDSRQEIAGILQDTTSNVGSIAASAMVQDFVAIDRLARAIRAFGCELKDVNVGLLDFPALVNGREVYLCWRYGEERIEYYHDLHTGYTGRQRLK